MKKVIYFMTLMFALVLMNTSCEKDPVTPDPSTALITLPELSGTWNFQLFQYAGLTPDVTPTTTQAQLNLNPITKNMRWVNLSLKIYTLYGLTWCDLIDGLDGPNNDILQNGLELNSTTNKITIENGLVFQIKSYDKTTKTLVLKLLEPIVSNDNVLENATYTLKKQ